jgi:ssDNA-binding Zn-finger/Zn-ribbon topoisomerase 1
MSKENGQSKTKTDRVVNRFEELLGQHMERLIGTREGIGGLSLNLGTISCLFILAERETEMETSGSSFNDRYTRETILQDLSELGLPPSLEFNNVLKEVIEKGYIAVDSEGWLFANKPAMSMAHLLDNAFGSVSGINFIAYIIQRVDEVATGRMKLKDALKQFEETLLIHGQPVLKETSKKTLPSKEKNTQTIERKKQLASQAKKLLEEYRNRTRKEQSLGRVAPEPLSELRVISPSGEIDQFELKDFSQKKDTVIEAREDRVVEPGHQAQEISREMPGGAAETVVSQAETAPPAETAGLSPEHEASDQSAHEVLTKPESDGPGLSRVTGSDEASSAETSPDYGEASASTLEPVARDTAFVPDEQVGTDKGPAQLEEARPPDVVGDRTEDAPPGSGPSLTDALIEEQIAAFEEGLAMICPICSIGNVKAERTAKDRIFYKCTNEKCIFISWGKPYHMGCPLCNNPFLVEISDDPDNISLKCPRATCSHRQNMADKMTGSVQEGPVAAAKQDSSAKESPPKKKRRKVVRKRLVRRKK